MRLQTGRCAYDNLSNLGDCVQKSEPLRFAKRPHLQLYPDNSSIRQQCMKKARPALFLSLLQIYPSIEESFLVLDQAVQRESLHNLSPCSLLLFFLRLEQYHYVDKL